MTRAAIAAVTLVAAALSAAAAFGAIRPAELEPSRGFCSEVPTNPDKKVPTAVNALDSTPDTTAPIAILDTGVDPATPELVGRIVSPFDAIGNTDDASDVDGHGTEVAAIAAAYPGLYRGVSPTSPIMPIRIYNGDGQTTTQATIAGIRWAIDHGAGVIDISGTQALDTASATDVTNLTRAIGDAFNRGILVVAPAGNEGKSAPDIPAALPHVIAVGSTDTVGNRSTFSNFGSWMELMAPGPGLSVPTPKKFCPNGFGLANGTSFAAPAVAGAAAIIGRFRPDLTPQQRVDLLKNSARDLGLSKRDDDTGYGMLDVGAALAAPAPTKEFGAEIDDDPIYVRGANAAKHPALLAGSKKSARITGQLQRGKDPADVYPVKVARNQRLVVSVNATLADSVLDVNIYKPGVGDYDVSNDATKQRVVGTGGFAVDPQLVARIKSPGTYYISVEVGDLIDDSDAEGSIIPASEPYVMAVSSKKLPKAKPKKKTKKKSTKKK